MSRFRPTGPRDTAPLSAGDGSFVGVQEKGEPDQLAPGLLRALVNGTCRDGTVRTRAGSQTPTSLQMPTLGAVFGSGVFSDPLETEWLLLATAAGIWRLRDGRTPFLIAIPEALAAPVKIVQAFRTVLLFRGAGLPPWSWDGEDGSAFAVIAQTATGSLSPIPNGPDRFGLAPVVLQNRLIIPHGRSQIAFSDVLDYTNYDAVFADFNVTGGNDNVLTAIFRYNEASLVIFNDQSVQQLTGITGDLAALSLSPVNDSVGCLAGATVARLGNDVLWLADGGVWQLYEVEQRRVTAPIPLSDPIPATMARIYWRAAARAVATVHEESYYLAVPLDRSEVSNAVLVFDSQRGAWGGVHTFPAGVQIDAFHRLDWFGRKRLHAVDYASGRVHLLYEGRFDKVGNTRTAIPLAVTTRSYLLDQPERKRFRRGRVYWKSWAATVGASLATDGIAESTVLAAALTRDRTAHMVFGKAAYDPSNAADDHAFPHREDYSVDIGTAFDPDDAGIDFDLEQHHRLAFTCSTRGRHAALTVTDSTGTLALTGIVLEGDPADKADRPAA